MTDLDPASVAKRLAVLRSQYVAEDLEAARVRLARERPRLAEPFDARVARALAELRALCELAEYLHGAR